MKQYKNEEIPIRACYEPRLLLAWKRMTLPFPALPCSFPLLAFPESPAVHILLLHAHSHFASPAVLPQSSLRCLIIVAQKIARYHSFKSQPRNRSLNASTYKDVWLDDTRRWLFWLTLSFLDRSRLFLYLAFVVCVSMVLLSVAAGARAGSVTVVWGLGTRREKHARDAAREKCVLNQPGPARPSPRARYR